VQFSDVLDNEGSNPSGIVVFDKNLDIKLRSVNGKNVSCISFIGNKLYTVCNRESGGLFVDGLKMIGWNSEYEIYDIAVDREYIYLVGKVYYRKNRSSVLGGVIYKFDRNFNKIDVDVITHSGIFLGCMLETYDLTNSMYNYNLDINTIPEKKEGYLKVIKHDTVQ